MLKDKILELVSRPNCYNVTFEHASYGSYYCKCQIDDKKNLYEGVSDSEEQAFDIAYEKYVKFKSLNINMDKDFVGGNNITQGTTKVTIARNSKNNRTTVQDIVEVDEDGYNIVEPPIPLNKFCADANITLFETRGHLNIYEYSRMFGPLSGDGGKIKVNGRSNQIIGMKSEWIS